ncbi:MAG: T9SS type A sorting domain-containing protein [Bacteroidales bacterium]|nr:T9SS type A sorting domain-containing protein [Bacteroidales bacterium]
MKTSIVLLTLFFASLLPTHIKAQEFKPLWEQCYGGTGWDEAYGITRAGDTYWVIGDTQSTDEDISHNHGGTDLWLINVDLEGNLISERCYGGSKGDFGYTDILKVNESTFYIVGGTTSVDGDIEHNPWPGDGGNLWTLKINSQQEIMWQSVVGGTGRDYLNGACVTSDGGIVLLASSTSEDGDITDHHGNWDYWLVKLGPEGDKQWTMSLGGVGYENAGSIIQTNDGGFMVVGSTDGWGGGNYDTTCNFHGYMYIDSWVVKLSSDHQIEWQQTYGGNYHEFGNEVIEIEDGYIILGYTMSNDGDVSGFHGDPGDPRHGGDVWVIKIDFSGNLIWQKCLGGTYREFARNIFKTSDGGFMIIGETSSKDGDVEGSHTITPGNSKDVWFTKINSDGELTWQYCYGKEGDEYLYRGVWQNSDFDYVVAIGTKSAYWRCNNSYYNPVFRVAELAMQYESIPDYDTLQAFVRVFPNPAHDQLNISPIADVRIESVRLFDALGVEVFQRKLAFNQKDYTIPVGDLPRGIYYYTIYSVNNSPFIGKVVLN